ncbi:hypothetical protein QR680_015746 [Steinernema hermaphroditum]|uniref:Uncharacterized protein n=1 Tax=Steinernema hermaphroditum TaxID=289476 RepID=A0AA39LKR6_9BILA|nr:hypothetical protein QR680_015746 [Steinernema hermaphroditum]
MYTTVVLIVILSATAHAQDVNSLASFFYSSITNFATNGEIVKVANAVANQACSGASLEQIGGNLEQTAIQNVGPQTAMRALAIAAKLKGDLGNDLDAVISAVQAAAYQLAAPVYNDLVQYCGSGTAAVFAQANNYANQQFAQQIFDVVYQAVSSVNPNDWATCRNDLANYIFFGNYGY